MQRIVHGNGVITWTFEGLAGYPVQAHVTTRHGGVSPSPWSSLNFSISRGDNPERVAQNRRRLAAALGLDPDSLVAARQIHGTGVAKVDWSDAGTWQAGVDALITEAVGLPLFLTFADCVPLVFYEPRRHVLGLCHAGWRGTVNGAAVATLWAMQAAYGVDPAHVRVGIGPSIGPASYQVGPDVLEMALARLPDAHRYFHYPSSGREGGEVRPHFDLWQANVEQLVDAGVRPEHIEVSGMDTATHTHDFFSHRAEQGRCGLFGVVAWLLPREPGTGVRGEMQEER